MALRFVTQASAAQADTQTGAAGLNDTAAVTAVVTARVERKLCVCERASGKRSERCTGDCRAWAALLGGRERDAVPQWSAKGPERA